MCRLINRWKRRSVLIQGTAFINLCYYSWENVVCRGKLMFSERRVWGTPRSSTRSSADVVHPHRFVPIAQHQHATKTRLSFHSEEEKLIRYHISWIFTRRSYNRPDITVVHSCSARAISCRLSRHSCRLSRHNNPPNSPPSVEGLWNKISMSVFWVVTPGTLVGGYERFGATYWIHLRGWRWRQYISPKRWYLPTSSHCDSTQNTNIIFTAVRNSNLSHLYISSFVRTLCFTSLTFQCEMFHWQGFISV
jgi:hypothetical protein